MMRAADAKLDIDCRGPSGVRPTDSKTKESEMLVEYIRYEVPAARHAEFLASYQAAARELAASDQCLSYEVSQGVEEPDHFMVRIQWQSLEGHEQGFRKSALFPGFFRNVKPFFEQIREMKHYRVDTYGKGAASA